MTTTDPTARMSPTSTHSTSPGWVLVGSTGLYAADCLRPGCIWTVTTSTPDAADNAAERHQARDHFLDQDDDQQDQDPEVDAA